MGAIPLYRATVGMDTVRHASDLAYNDETGGIALSKAVNVRINPANRIERVHGFTPLYQNGAYHSGWSDYGDAFCMKGTNLYRFNTDKTLTGVRDSLTGNRMAYAQHGDTTYYSDGLYNGKINDAVSTTWLKGTYLGPGKADEYLGPPLAKKLEVFNNHMLMVPVDDPNTVIWSEQGQFGLYKRATSIRRFESEVIMVLGVEGGCFISTRHGIHFCEGPDPNQWKMRSKTNYPAVEWSESTERVPGHELGIKTPGLHRTFRAETGAMAALANGELYNMTEKRIDSPVYGQGASIKVGQYLIHSIF